MTLENLLAIHRLTRHEASRESILKLLAAAERNLMDARAPIISAENRFDAAYKAILQCAGDRIANGGSTVVLNAGNTYS